MTQEQTSLDELAFFAHMLLKEVEEKKKALSSSQEIPATNSSLAMNLGSFRDIRDKAIRYRDWKRRFCDPPARSSLARSLDKLKDVESQWNGQKQALQHYDLRYSLDPTKFASHDPPSTTQKTSNTVQSVGQILKENLKKVPVYQRSRSQDVSRNDGTINESFEVSSKNTSLVVEKAAAQSAKKEGNRFKRSSTPRSERSYKELAQNRRSASPAQLNPKLSIRSQILKSHTEINGQDASSTKKPFLKRNSDSQRRAALAQKTNSSGNNCFSIAASNVQLTDSSPVSNAKNINKTNIETGSASVRMEKPSAWKECFESPKKEKKIKRNTIAVKAKVDSNLRSKTPTTPRKEKVKSSVNIATEGQTVAIAIGVDSEANQAESKSINLADTSPTEMRTATEPEHSSAEPLIKETEASLEAIIKIPLMDLKTEASEPESPTNAERHRQKSNTPKKSAKIPVVAASIKARIGHARGPDTSNIQRAPRSASCQGRRANHQDTKNINNSPKNTKARPSSPLSSRDAKKPKENVIKISREDLTPRKKVEEPNEMPAKQAVKEIVEKVKHKQPVGFNRDKVIQGILEKLEKEKQKCKPK